ncbi:MAG TPA: hypothetical protein VFG50_06620 [Rhodothermales bacterium]|nr:hypothetical protein [Rhodothermales bacterium]
MAADDVSVLAQEAGLSPLLTRIALILSDIEGDEKARLFIESIQNDVVDPLVDEDVAPIRRLNRQTLNLA